MKDGSSHPIFQVNAIRSKILRFAGESLWVIACALALAGSLILHRSWPIQWIGAGAMFILSLSAIVLTRFHVRHSPLGGISVVIAERILWVGALAAILGVQVINQSMGPRDLVGAGFLITAPLLASAMLLSALIGPAISVFTLTVVCFLLGISGSVPIETLVASWLSGAIGSHSVNPLKQRSDLLRSMTIVALAQAVIATATTAMTMSTVRPVVESAAWAALAAVIGTSIFWLGVALLERLFGLVSDWSLLELCSPEHPLLRELTLKAPGTYAHSVMVGNLAENAAREVGANAVLCRALAYFHDVGKLVRPSYFIENQRGFNPHDQIPPQLSARILIEHVKDGVELARKHRLPRVIQDGISQHHGTSLIAYFWNRAHEAESTAPITEDSFRYDGPKPQSKELAILHLSDSIEALSRSLNSSSTEEIEIAVRRVIEERRADGQLDECDLTFADLRKIEQSFLRSLGALRHERIAYPEEMTHDTEKPSHYDLEQLRAAYPDEHPPHGA